MSGQTLTDRIAAAQYSLTGSEVSRAVCKATTHEVMAPKKKHLECKLVQVKITPFSGLFMSVKCSLPTPSVQHNGLPTLPIIIPQRSSDTTGLVRKVCCTVLVSLLWNGDMKLLSD